MIKKILFIILLPLNFHAFADGHSLQNKPIINLSMAKVMADACEADQKSNNYNPVNIAIVDAGNDLVDRKSVV